MRKSFIIALLIAVTFTLPLHAQKKTTREMTYALVGPVRTIRTEIANVSEKDGHYVEGVRTLQMTVSFNEDGNRTELGLYDGMGSLSRRIVTKFEGRKPVEFLNYDGSGKVWLRTVVHYDAEDRVRETANYDGDGSLVSKTTSTRNALGQAIEVAEYDAKGTLLSKFSNRFNAAGELNTIERSFYSADGSLRRQEFYNASEKRLDKIAYNRDGSLAEKSIRVDQEITDYAADGSLKKNTFITSMGRLPDELTYNPDGTTRRESQIPDEIDAHGNWIKQTKWVSDSKGTRPVKVTYRVITYYYNFKI